MKARLVLQKPLVLETNSNFTELLHEENQKTKMIFKAKLDQKPGT